MRDEPAFQLERVLAAVKRGETDQFRLIVREYGLLVRGYLSARLAHQDDADDLAQEVFLIAYAKIGSSDRATFVAWLLGIARNQLRNHWRSRARREDALARFREEISEIVEPDPDSAASWLKRLRSDDILRRQFAAEIHLAGLTRTVQAGEPRWLRIEEELGSDEGEATAGETSVLDAFEDRIMCRLDTAFPAKHRLHVSASSPWLAAAAGLVIGLFGASVVWAFANPKAVATASRLFTLVEGSFEKGGGVITSGLPTSFGIWSGDRSEIVSDGAAATAERKGVLRFLEAEREPALPAYGAAACDVFQLVDLRSLKSPGADDDATLELSVRFRDGRTAKGETLNFFGRIILFSGDPSSIVPGWPFSQEKALGTAMAHVPSEGGAPDAWHLGIAKVLMPAEADFAVIHIMVHEPESRPGTKAAFGEQYADDVRLTLTTQPTLPVRNAQP